MAELLKNDEQGNAVSIEVDVKCFGWVTEPGGPGPDSPEAKAWLETEKAKAKAEWDEKTRKEKELKNG